MRKKIQDYRPILILLLVISLFIWAGNYYLYGKWMPVKLIGSVVALMGAYMVVLYGTFRQLLTKSLLRTRLLALGVLALVFYSLFDVTYLVIYRLYPSLGIFLFDPNKAFNEFIFKERMMTSFTVIFVISLGTAGIGWSLGRVRVLTTELETLNSHFSAAHIYPHFVESVTATVMGQSLFKSSHGGRRCLSQMAGVMRYALDIRSDPHRIVSLEEEWKQLRRLADVARWKYSDEKVSLEGPRTLVGNHRTVPMSMVTALENALKYADLQQDGHIHIELEVWDEGYRFLCENSFDPEVVPMQPGSGFGLSDLRKRLKNSGLGVKLSIHCAHDRRFCFILTSGLAGSEVRIANLIPR